MSFINIGKPVSFTISTPKDFMSLGTLAVGETVYLDEAHPILFNNLKVDNYYYKMILTSSKLSTP